jgi:hypothetical protein
MRAAATSLDLHNDASSRRHGEMVGRAVACRCGSTEGEHNLNERFANDIKLFMTRGNSIRQYLHAGSSASAVSHAKNLETVIDLNDDIRR